MSNLGPAPRTRGGLDPRTGGRRIGLAATMGVDIDPIRFIRAAGAAGFDHVGLRVRPAGAEQVAPFVADAALCRQTRDVLGAVGVALADVEVVRIGPAELPSGWEEVVEVAADLGAERVLVANGAAGPEAAARQFRELGANAASVGLRAVFEFTPYGGVRTLNEATELLERAQVPGAGLLLDVLHLYRTATPPEALRNLAAAQVACLQLCDAPKTAPRSLTAMRDEAVHSRLMPGRGDIPIAEYLAALAPDLPVTVEAPSDALRTTPIQHRAAESWAAVTSVLSNPSPGAFTRPLRLNTQA